MTHETKGQYISESPPQFIYTCTIISAMENLTGPEIGPDRNSGSGTSSGRIWAGTGSGRFGRYQTGTAIFFLILYYRFYDELPATRAPSSCLAGSRAPLQFPDCIKCYNQVPRLHHVLSTSSLAVRLYEVLFSSATLFGDTWRGKLSLFLPFISTLSTDISA